MTQHEEFYRAILNSMSTGFTLHKIVRSPKGDVDCELIDTNPAFEALTGLKKENITGKTLKEILPAINTDTGNWISQCIGAALQGKSTEFDHYSEPQKKWFRTSAFSPDQEYLAILFNEITHLKNPPKTPSKHTQLTVAQSERSSHIAHDMRTPLNAVIGFSDLLSVMVTGSQQKSYVDAIKKAGQKLLALINEVFETPPERTPEPAPAPLEETPNIGNVSFQKARVLVVDDIESNRFLLKTFLSKFNLETEEAEDGKKAIECVKESRPDLIFMDIMMPVMDGYKAAKLLKASTETQSIPLIALTAATRSHEREKIKNSGFDSFLPKPISLPELFRELLRHLPYSLRNKNGTHHHTPLSPKGSTKHDAVRDIHNLVRSLETEMLPLWEEIRGALDMDDVEAFAVKLKTLAQQHNAQNLISHAGTLLDSIQSFDIENIQETLKEFPALIENLRKTGNPPALI